MKKYSVSVDWFFQSIIIVLLLLTPIFNFMELTALFSGNYISAKIVLTPIYIKIIKDVAMLLIVAVGLVNVAQNKKIYTNKLYLILVLAILLSALTSVIVSPNVTNILAGLRWSLPFLLVLFLFDSIDTKFQYRISTLLTRLLVFGFLLQVVQAFYFRAFYGLSSFTGLNARNPGFYFTPSAMAAFTLAAAYYIDYFREDDVYKKILLFFVVPVSVLLTGSGTGLLVLCGYFIIKAYKRIHQKQLMIFLGVCLFLAGLVALPIISGRAIIYESILKRGEIFAQAFKNENMVLSQSFGSATNAAVLSDDRSDNAISFIADSTITSVMFNIGSFALVVFVLFFVSISRKKVMYLHFWLIYGAFIVTTIIFELFPLNLLLAVNLAYFIKIKKDLQIENSN